MIQQIDPGSYGQEAEPGRVDISPERLRAAAQHPMLDDGSVVDVMVLFIRVQDGQLFCNRGALSRRPADREALEVRALSPAPG